MKLIYITVEKVDAEATGEQARAERLHANLTLGLVARQMGLSSMFLSNLERGKKTWNKTHVTKFNSAIKALRRTT